MSEMTHDASPMSARAQAVYRRTYSRQKEDGTNEVFADTIDRVVGHQRWLWERALGRELNQREHDELGQLRELCLQRKVEPSGRILWLGGTEIARTRELSQFACSGHVVRTVYDVVDAFWLLLNGCGIGVKPEDGCLNGFARPIRDVRVIRSERTEKGGAEHNVETWDPETRTWTIRVGDSGEAWAKSIGKLIAGKYPADTLVLDFSELRPEGSVLSRYGWKSAGDTVISREYPKIAAILSRRAGQLLSKLDIAEVLNHLGVIQTGRRGAEILLMNEGDRQIDDFIAFKENCYSDPAKKHRQQSNNSILFKDKPPRARLEHIFAQIVKTGGNEPAFINVREARRRAPWFATANPCVEILLADKGFCNLFEVGVYAFDHLGDLLEAIRIAARANYRQTLVDLDDGILQRTWHENNEFLHLCGVSLTGIVARPDLTPHDLRAMRTSAHIGAWSMADELGMPHPKNVTCGKPSGTLSKVMDSPGEGAHKPLGKYVFNSIVFGRTEEMVDVLRRHNYEVVPHPTEETMVLVKFPVVNEGVPFDDFVDPRTGVVTPVNLEPAVSQLERYKLYMDNWCDQNMSMTVYYDPEEVPGIVDWLLDNWDSYVGLSWGFRTDPTKTAKDFGAAYLPQAVVDQETFEKYASQLLPIDWDHELSPDRKTWVDLDQLQDAECSGGACPVR